MTTLTTFDCPDCSASFAISQQHVEAAQEISCPVCNEELLVGEDEAEDDED
jgi:DNA-directed RNA polymerase subunit RPC12/RpoP